MPNVALIIVPLPDGEDGITPALEELTNDVAARYPDAYTVMVPDSFTELGKALVSHAP